VLTDDHPHQSTHRVVDLARRLTIEGGNGGCHAPNPHIALERPHPVFTHDIPARSRSLSNCPPTQAKPGRGAHMAASFTEGARGRAGGGSRRPTSLKTPAQRSTEAHRRDTTPASRSALSRSEIVSPRVALLQVLMVCSHVLPGLALGLGVRHIGNRIVFIRVLHTAGIWVRRGGDGADGKPGRRLSPASTAGAAPMHGCRCMSAHGCRRAPARRKWKV